MCFITTNGFAKAFHRLCHHHVPIPEPVPFKLAKFSGLPIRKFFNECLSSLLDKSLSPHSRLCEARKLHAILLVSGILNPKSDIASQASFLGSHLVQVYAQLGSLEEALLVFNGFHCIQNIACNAILRAYVDTTQFSQAIHFFNHLVFKLCFLPDNYTWPLVLKACSGLSALEQGRKLNDLICFFENYCGFKSNVYTKCALIDMFAKCGSLDEARKVFDDMSPDWRDLASWTAIICGTIHQGKWLEALGLFRMMRVEGTRPDSVVIAAILPACGRSEARQVGMSLQGCAMKSGFHHDMVVSNAAIDMYCKLGDIDQACSLFYRMLYKDIVSWNTLIAGYSLNCQYHRSIELYSEMINLGIIPGALVVSTVLHALGKLNLSEQGATLHGFILKQGFDFDVVVASALIDMYSNCGFTKELGILLSMWSDWDIMIWNSAISGLASRGNFDLALNTFRDLWKARVKPNSITLMSILPICTKMGALKQGMEVHCHVLRNCESMTVSVGNSLIDVYCKSGYLGYGLKVFDHMTEKDIISYNTMISAYGFHGFGNQALILFDEIRSSAIQPTKATFVGLLSSCSHAGLVRQGWSIYSSMINDYGLVPNMEHYSCMVDLLGRAGHINDAFKFIREMPGEPDGNVLGCLLSACRMHNMRDPVDLLGQEFLQVMLEDTGYHVLLSNIFASTKKWKDASRVRVLMKEEGLKKIPGKSWIQTSNHTHIFESRDTTHKEFPKLQHILQTLSSDMKQFYVVDPCFSIPSF